MKIRTVIISSLLLLLWLACGCTVNEADPEDEENADYWEGVGFDAENPNESVGGGKEDGNSYDVPTDLPELSDPEIIVSQDGLTVHLFDRATGFSEVFPVGVGVLNSAGVSITPTGHFATGPDTGNGWWYIARRWTPAHFGGFPFIRLTAENSRGQNTYGLHGPITRVLNRGYVSHGCMRMEGEDVVRLFYLIRNHASTPVTIQRETELDAAGNVVDIDTEITLWEVGEEIDYGASVGDAPPRDDTGTDSDGCADDRLESDDDVPVEPQSYRGLILCKGDTDRYLVELPAGQRLSAHIHFVHQISDLDLRVFGPDGEIAGQAAGTSDDETVELESEAGGNYVIEVFMYGDGESNGYSLDVEFD